MGEGTPPRRNVGIFVDLENLFGGYEGKVSGVQLGKVMRGIEQIVRANDLGVQTAVAKAYANWGHTGMAAYKREMLACGVEPVQVFSFNKVVKNAADIELCVDVLAVAHDLPWVDVFVIVTGDGGFIPLIRRLHSLNKYAIVVSTNGPDAGDVNSLLKSVADEYHQIDVSGTLSKPNSQTLKATPAVKTKVAEPAKVTTLAKVVKSQEAGEEPTLAALRKAILNLSKTDRLVLVEGQVNTATLGTLLRKKWPALNYSAYGCKTLSALVKNHCGLDPYRPVPKGSVAKVPPAKNTPPVRTIEVSTREEYMAAVRGLFTDGVLGLAVRDHESNGVGLSQIGTQISELIQGYSLMDTGFPKLHMALRYALADTAYYVSRAEDKSLAVVHSDHLNYNDALPHLTEQDLKSPEVVRGVLGPRMPTVSYPEQFVLSDVIRVVLAIGWPRDLVEYTDIVSAALPAVLPETIRETLGLLHRVGVLMGDGGTESLTSKPVVDTETAAIQIIIDDAMRRAAEIQWPISEAELLDALY